MIGSPASVWIGLFLLGLAAGPTFEAKETDRPIPTQIPESLKKLLKPRGWDIRKGDTVWGHFHPVKTMTTVATEDQVKNGLTMDDFPTGQLAGIIELSHDARDYRNQLIPAGIYSLRLGCQPESDDHRDTAPGRFFFLLCPIAGETDENPGDLKALMARGKIPQLKHPSPWFAFQGKPDPADRPMFQIFPPRHESVVWAQVVDASGIKARITLGWTIAGPANE